MLPPQGRFPPFSSPPLQQPWQGAPVVAAPELPALPCYLESPSPPHPPLRPQRHWAQGGTSSSSRPPLPLPLLLLPPPPPPPPPSSSAPPARCSTKRFPWKNQRPPRPPATPRPLPACPTRPSFPGRTRPLGMGTGGGRPCHKTSPPLPPAHSTPALTAQSLQLSWRCTTACKPFLHQHQHQQRHQQHHQHQHQHQHKQPPTAPPEPPQGPPRFHRGCWSRPGLG